MHVVDVLPRDAIRSVDDPVFGPEYFGDPEDEVVVVDGEVGADPPRAYPLRVLGAHEIVNDWVGDRPLAVTWCPICWSSAVYVRRANGRTLEFGVSGKLADDALVMYDRETGSEWRQPTGECFRGSLAGESLAAVPAPVVSWGEFRAEHPDGVVLQPVRSPPREAYDMERYREYAGGGPFGLYGIRGEGRRRSWDRTDLDAKSVVLGVVIDGDPVGYPVSRVADAGGVVTDRVGGSDVVVLATPEGTHAFENPGLDFDRAGERTFVADGTTWDGVTGESDDGRRLERVPATRQFAFAWQDSHGDAFWSPDR